MAGKSEARIQQECYMWFHNNYPELRGSLFAVPNGTATSIQQGKLMKQTGTYAGVADMLFMYHGITVCLELKTETGVQSVVQKKWEAHIKDQGFKYYIVRNLEQFKRIIRSYTLT